jgi:hypothetical protein
MKKGKEEIKGLTAEELAEFTACSISPFKFAPHIKVIHPLKGKVPFNLYPYQIALLWAFLKNRFNIVLKFRQAGVTELISLFCLWMAMFHSHKNIVIISIKDRVAKKVLKKIKFMYRNLPAHLKVPVINGRGEDIGTSTEMEFSNGSIISSIPTTEDAGRSEAVSLLVMDEAAIVRWAEKIWSAAFPTLSTGGRAIINSTAYGVDNFFHTLWVNAFAGGNPFVPIRLRWKMHPERDQAWYDEQRSILGERRTAQEIDGDFLTSGNTVFDLVDIRALEELIPRHKVIDSALNGRLKIYKHPVPGEKYFLAADVSTGRSRDYSTILILNRKGEEMLSFKGKIPIKRLTKLIRKYGKKYNWALVAPESNDIGLSVASDLEEAHYPNLYYSKALIRKKGESKPKEELIPGWYTTRKNRAIIIAELEDDIRNDVLRPKNQFFVDEAYTFIYDNNNKPVAMNKNGKAEDDILKDDVHTDDMILTYAIANRIRKGKIKKSANPK